MVYHEILPYPVFWKEREETKIDAAQKSLNDFDLLKNECSQENQS